GMLALDHLTTRVQRAVGLEATEDLPGAACDGLVDGPTAQVTQTLDGVADALVAALAERDRSVDERAVLLEMRHESARARRREVEGLRRRERHDELLRPRELEEPVEGAEVARREHGVRARAVSGRARGVETGQRRGVRAGAALRVVQRLGAV